MTSAASWLCSREAEGLDSSSDGIVRGKEGLTVAGFVEDYFPTSVGKHDGGKASYRACADDDGLASILDHGRQQEIHR